jgi:hypothetical protein
MKNGVLEVWAKDFDKGSFSNCFTSQLYFTFDNWPPVLSKLSKQHYFRANGEEVTSSDTLALYASGQIQKWVPTFVNGVLIGGTSAKLFGCKVGDGKTFPRSEVKMSVWDANFQSDFCTITLNLVDNGNGCGSISLLSIGGSISTPQEDKVKDVNITLESNLPEFPRYEKTNIDGNFIFESLPSGIDYKLTAHKNDEYLNGVNTLDLVYLQRHILGISKLDDAYKMIAADIDGDQNIKVSDIVLLRKTILGIADQEDTKSWKFIKSNVSDPWPLEEFIAHSVLNENKGDANFTAVKMGDLNGDAYTNFQSGLQKRNKEMAFALDDISVEAGKHYTIPMFISKSYKVYGLQSAFKTKDLTIQNVGSDHFYLDEDHIGRPQNNLLTVSCVSNDGTDLNKNQVILYLEILAHVNGKLSELLQLETKEFRPEIYVDDMQTYDLSIEYRSDVHTKLELLQNVPNPWQNETRINYNVPKSGLAKISIYDLEGRKIYQRSIYAKAGMNSEVITARDLSYIKGILQYQVEFDGEVHTKKMMVIK